MASRRSCPCRRGGGLDAPRPGTRDRRAERTGGGLWRRRGRGKGWRGPEVAPASGFRLPASGSSAGPGNEQAPAQPRAAPAVVPGRSRLGPSGSCPPPREVLTAGAALPRLSKTGPSASFTSRDHAVQDCWHSPQRPRPMTASPSLISESGSERPGELWRLWRRAAGGGEEAGRRPELPVPSGHPRASVQPRPSRRPAVPQAVSPVLRMNAGGE